MEAINGDYDWSSGMSWKATLNTRPDKFPGRNKAGKILMTVRKSLLKSQTPTSSIDTNKEPEPYDPSKDWEQPLSLPESVKTDTAPKDDSDNDDISSIKSGYITELDTDTDTHIGNVLKNTNNQKQHAKMRTPAKRVRTPSGYDQLPHSKQMKALMMGIDEAHSKLTPEETTTHAGQKEAT